MSRGTAVILPAAIRRAILAQARREAPRECCGFLLGRGHVITHVAPMRNVAARQAHRRYRVDPARHLELQRVLRDVTPPLAIIGVYHSHPRGRAWPSETDVAEAHYPDWIHVIAGLRPRAAIAAFRIAGGQAAGGQILRLNMPR